jgi:16S rRNA processing protein RimM
MGKAPANAGKSGSPSQGEPVYLAVGLLRRPHGIHGEILMEIYTDFPERLKEGTTVFLGRKHKPASIRRIRSHNEGLLLGFEGVQTPESAGLLRNLMVYVRTSTRPALPAGQYYHHQMIGMNVMDDFGHELGRLTEIIQTGANDVYVVKSKEGTEMLLPSIKQVIMDVDVAGGKMVVHLIPGLLEREE